MNSAHAHFNISASKIGAKLKPHGSVCPPFWILTVEWSGAKKRCFSKTLFSSVSGGRFRTAPFSVIVFGVIVWMIAVSGAKGLRFRLKTD